MDLRGDGDIYDYCVDDPVNLLDVKGLEFSSAEAADAARRGHEGISHPFGAKHGATPNAKVRNTHSVHVKYPSTHENFGNNYPKPRNKTNNSNDTTTKQTQKEPYYNEERRKKIRALQGALRPGLEAFGKGIVAVDDKMSPFSWAFKLWNYHKNKK